MMMIKQFLLNYLLKLVLALLVLSSSLAISKETIQSGEGIAIISNITIENARSLALDRARNDALEQIGFTISGTTASLKQSSEKELDINSISQFIETQSRGLIVKEEITYDRMESQHNPPIYRVRGNFTVVMTDIAPDPTFDLDFAVDKYIVRNGESITLSLRSTKDCYVTLFNFYSNDSLSIVLPNPLLTKVKLIANQPVQIPEKGWELAVSLRSGMLEDNEALLAVATLDDIPLRINDFIVRDGLLSTKDALVLCNQWLSKIPANRRTQSFQAIRIVR